MAQHYHGIGIGLILRGRGLQATEEKTMIFVVVDGSRITVLRDIIRRNDPDAFMIVMEAAEMLRSLSENALSESAVTCPNSSEFPKK